MDRWIDGLMDWWIDGNIDLGLFKFNMIRKALLSWDKSTLLNNWLSTVFYDIG